MRKKYLQHLNVPLSELNFKQQLYFKRIFLPMSRWILRHASGAPFNNMKIVLQKWRIQYITIVSFGLRFAAMLPTIYL